MPKASRAERSPKGSTSPARRPLAKRPGRFHHGDLRWALLEAAQRLLEREGTLGVGLRAAARLAGVSQTAPYRHFADKEAMLAALAEQGLRQMGDRMAEAARSNDRPCLALRAIAEAYVTFGVERPHLFRLMFGPEVADKERCPAVRDAGHRAHQIVLDLIAAGQAAGELRSGDPSDLALAMWAGVHGAASLAVDGQLRERLAAGSPAALGRAVAEGLMLGMAAR